MDLRRAIARIAPLALGILLSSAPAAAHDDTFEGDEPGECVDRADNDRDGLFDCDDPDCQPGPDCREPDEPVISDRVGYLRLNSIPWSTVYVDGLELGVVPIDQREVAAGVHIVEFRCGGCAEPLVEQVRVVVAPGEIAKAVVRFDEE